MNPGVALVRQATRRRRHRKCQRSAATGSTRPLMPHRARAERPIWRRSLPASMVDSGAQIWVICAAARVVGRLNRHRAVAALYVMRAIVLARLI